MIRALAILFLLQSVCVAQIDVAVTKSLELTGVKAKVVGDRVFVSTDAIPKLVEVASISVTSPAKFVRVRAFKSLFEQAQITKLTESEYLLSGEPGRYAIEVMTFDPTNGIDERSVEVSIGSSPSPEPAVELTKTAREVRTVAVGLMASMSADFAKLADDTKSGKFKTVIDASNASNVADASTRAAFKQSMAKIMEPLLGSTNLPPTAAVTFQEISNGFKAVK